MKSWICLTALAAASVVPRLAMAQPIDNIGNAGQVVIGVDRVMGLSFSRDTTSDEEEDVSGTSVKTERTRKLTTLGLAGLIPPSIFHVPRLGLDYFVTDGFSIGGSAMYSRLSGETERETTAGGQTDSSSRDIDPVHYLLIQPRVGYSFIFDETFAIWPRAGITWARGWSTNEYEATDPTGNSTTYERDESETLLALTVEANVVISPMKHFAFLVGPFLDLGLSGSSKSETNEPGVETDEADRKLTVYGLQVGLAGYF